MAFKKRTRFIQVKFNTFLIERAIRAISSTHTHPNAEAVGLKGRGAVDDSEKGIELLLDDLVAHGSGDDGGDSNGEGGGLHCR